MVIVPSAFCSALRNSASGVSPALLIIIIIIGYIFTTIISQNMSDKTKDMKVVGTDT